MRVDDTLAIKHVRMTRIYHEIVDQIRQLIAAGRIKPGVRLPPERDLAEQFRARCYSVSDAIRRAGMSTMTAKVLRLS